MIARRIQSINIIYMNITMFTAMIITAISIIITKMYTYIFFIM